MSTKQLEKTTSAKKKKQTNNKQAKKAPKTNKKTTKKYKNKKEKRRIFPIWLRIIVILILTVIALIAGLMIGYGILGDGKALDALRVETWQHIIDIVKMEK